MIQTSEEIETSLIILSDTPNLTVTRLSELQEIKDYRFQRTANIKHIHDTYFDTDSKNGLLQAHKMALRIRKIDENDHPLITLKGRYQQEEWGSPRLEHEELLSKESLNTILGEIKEKIPTATLLSNDYECDGDSYELIMERTGLHAIQDRTTARRVMNIYSKKDDSLYAELDVDYTLYNLSHNNQIGYYNVETELKGSNKPNTDLKMLTEELIQICQPDLKIWEHSKFATGKAIKRLHERAMLNGFVTYISNNIKNLKPAAFEKIDQLIRIEGL